MGGMRAPVSLYGNMVHVHACVSCVPIRASVSPSVNGVHLSCVRCIEGSQRSMQEALSKRSVLAAGGSGQTSVLLRDPESLSAHPGNPQGHP